MNCELFLNKASNSFYVVIAVNMVYPPALFACQHCAEQWAQKNIGNGYGIKKIPLSDFYTHFCSNHLDSFPYVVKIHDSNHATADRTLNEHELKA